MVKTEHKDINGHTWTVTQFPAGKGVKLLTYLFKIAGPSLVSVVGSLKGGKALLDADIKPEMLESAVQELVTNLDENDVLMRIKSMLELTKKDGVEVTPETFDLVFQGDYMTLFKVLAFVLEVNYSSFFGASGTNAKDSAKGMDTESSVS